MKTVAKYNEPKTYTVLFKDKTKTPLYLTESRGKAIAQWWLESKHNSKIEIHDEEGDFQEILDASQISWIGKKEKIKEEVDDDGNTGEPGYRCEWGEWHSNEVAKQENCGCWNRYGCHYSKMFDEINKKYGENTSIKTSKDFTAEMRAWFLLNF